MGVRKSGLVTVLTYNSAFLPTDVAIHFARHTAMQKLTAVRMITKVKEGK